MLFHSERLNCFDVEKFISTIFGEVHHTKRLQSIANAALGVVASASLIIHRVGRGLAKIQNLSDKHAIKQVDRLLSNDKFDVEATDSEWVSFLIGERKKVKITMDWTDFDKDSHTTICLNLVTSHGRATPLLWKTVNKKKLKDNRNNYEDAILLRLYNALPADVNVTILADRGFFDTRLFEFLKQELGFDFCIRVKNNTHITNIKGETRSAKDWVPVGGKTKTIKNGKITAEKISVATIAIKHAKGMKQPWCIACSNDISGSGIISWYAKRWGCEPQFRDTKDIHFGMGMHATNIKSTLRRDRMLFISAIAVVLLTFLGAAGEAIGLDKYLKANTSKKRSLSLFRQGCILFNRLPKMIEKTARKLLTEFGKLIVENQKITTILGVV